VGHRDLRRPATPGTGARPSPLTVRNSGASMTGLRRFAVGLASGPRAGFSTRTIGHVSHGGFDTRLVEREDQLATLGMELAAVRRGAGRMVLVTGEAGIGKSALVAAFLEQLPRGTTVYRGACDPVVPARAFAPVSDIAAVVHGGLAAALLV